MYFGWLLFAVTVVLTGIAAVPPCKTLRRPKYRYYLSETAKLLVVALVLFAAFSVSRTPISEEVVFGEEMDAALPLHIQRDGNYLSLIEGVEYTFTVGTEYGGCRRVFVPADMVIVMAAADGFRIEEYSIFQEKISTADTSKGFFALPRDIVLSREKEQRGTVYRVYVPAAETGKM